MIIAGLIAAWILCGIAGGALLSLSLELQFHGKWRVERSVVWNPVPILCGPVALLVAGLILVVKVIDHYVRVPLRSDKYMRGGGK